MLRRNFITGAFALGPIALTVYGVCYIESLTADVSRWLFGQHVWGVGLIVAACLIYLVGAAINTWLGKWAVGLTDRLMARVPVIGTLYGSWKQIAYTPGGGDGVFARVVLVPVDDSQNRQLGFAAAAESDKPDADVTVFLPAVPNPLAGRLVLVPVGRLIELPIGVEEAFKFLLSNGNYVPAGLLGHGNDPPQPAGADAAPVIPTITP